MPYSEDIRVFHYACIYLKYMFYTCLKIIYCSIVSSGTECSCKQRSKNIFQQIRNIKEGICKGIYVVYLQEKRYKLF